MEKLPKNAVTPSLTTLKKQSAILLKYITGQSNQPDELVTRCALFTQASDHTVNDDRLLQIALTHPRLLPSIDAYCALLRPNDELRRRLYYAFAVAEAAPDNARQFLSESHSPFYLVTLFGIGVRGACRVAIGFTVSLRYGRGSK